MGEREALSKSGKETGGTGGLPGTCNFQRGGGDRRKKIIM